MVLRNAYFEGFTQGVEVTNLFVFKFFRDLIHAAFKYLGSWHDTKLPAVPVLYSPKLSNEVTPPEMTILGDSAFNNNTAVWNGKILIEFKPNKTRDVPGSAALALIQTILQHKMSSTCQVPDGVFVQSRVLLQWSKFNFYSTQRNYYNNLQFVLCSISEPANSSWLR